MRLPAALAGVFLVLAPGACESVPATNGPPTGGATGADAGAAGAAGAAAGHVGAGGVAATGGVAGTGGAVATGGTTSSGGASGHAGAAGAAGAHANGGAAGSPASGGGGGAAPCDGNGDGLDESAGCLTLPVTLRFVNATARGTFDVYVAGATNPVTVGLAPYEVAIVGPVQAKLLDYEFRDAGVAPVTGEVNLLGSSRTTLVAYLDPTTTTPTLKTNAAAQRPPDNCGSTGAGVDFGEFTSIASPPVAILFRNSGGTSWTSPFSPGLGVGEIFGSGCWNGGTAIEFGAGPKAAVAPTIVYQAVSLANLMSYQLLMTDDRIIVIDGLDQVSNLPKL